MLQIVNVKGYNLMVRLISWFMGTFSETDKVIYTFWHVFSLKGNQQHLQLLAFNKNLKNLGCSYFCENIFLRGVTKKFDH